MKSDVECDKHTHTLHTECYLKNKMTLQKQQQHTNRSVQQGSTLCEFCSKLTVLVYAVPPRHKSL